MKIETITSKNITIGGTAVFDKSSKLTNILTQNINTFKSGLCLLGTGCQIRVPCSAPCGRNGNYGGNGAGSDLVYNCGMDLASLHFNVVVKQFSVLRKVLCSQSGFISRPTLRLDRTLYTVASRVRLVV